MFCSRSPAVDKYLHKETKKKCVYSSFFNPLRDCGSTSSIHFFHCGTAGALVLHQFIFCFSTARVRDRRSTSSTLIYYSFFSTFIYIVILTAGLREQAINVTQSWRGILKLLRFGSSVKVEFNIADNSSQLIQGHKSGLFWFARVYKDW